MRNLAITLLICLATLAPLAAAYECPDPPPGNPCRPTCSVGGVQVNDPWPVVETVWDMVVPEGLP